MSFHGPAYAGYDNRSAALQLVEQGLCDAVLFTPRGVCPSLCVPIVSLFACPSCGRLCVSLFVRHPRVPSSLKQNTHNTVPKWYTKVATGELQIPHEALYKKHVLLMRGRFNPFTNLHNDMLVNAAQQFFCQGLAPGVVAPRVTDSLDECVYREDTLVLLEISTNDMLDAGDMLDWCGQSYT